MYIPSPRDNDMQARVEMHATPLLALRGRLLGSYGLLEFPTQSIRERWGNCIPDLPVLVLNVPRKLKPIRESLHQQIPTDVHTLTGTHLSLPIQLAVSS